MVLLYHLIPSSFTPKGPYASVKLADNMRKYVVKIPTNMPSMRKCGCFLHKAAFSFPVVLIFASLGLELKYSHRQNSESQVKNRSFIDSERRIYSSVENRENKYLVISGVSMEALQVVIYIKVGGNFILPQFAF